MSVLLDISQVDMVFPTPQGDFTALKDVDLKIKKGEFISLILNAPLVPGCAIKSAMLMV